MHLLTVYHFSNTLQILGAIFGSLVYAGLIPGLRIASTHFTGETAPGCFAPAAGVHNAELFWWEVRPWHNGPQSS